ncbi:MAG: O-antigen ligase family protein [Mariprofundus sp.]|nr:O-antigen ligase family protein [Mariprofundus sp.]
MFSVILFFLCLSGFLFPFAVAATNAGLGIMLLLGLVSGVWWRGAKQCWQRYRLLSVLLCLYLGLVLLGMLWSLDFKWGLHVVGRQWFWLLIPIVMIVLENKRYQQFFLISLSLGLSLNLLFCLLQMFALVSVDTDGSNASDATGLIGHIGFGFVYGVWAAWLLHLGLLWKGWQRLVSFGLAAWSYVMIFSAQGRSGYLVAVLLLLCVLGKWIYDSRNWRTIFPIVVLFLLILVVVGIGPGKERLYGTWLAFTQTEQAKDLDARDSSDNAILATDERFNMWKVTADIWQGSPLLGVGTGGLPQAVKIYNKNHPLSAVAIFPHPHNQYLLHLVRWGPVGLLMLLSMLYYLIWKGLVVDWQQSLVAPFMTLSGLALALHGLTSASMEEHFSAILAVLLLGVGLAERKSSSC